MDARWGSDLAPLIFVALFVVVGVLLYPLAQGIGRRLGGDTTEGASGDLAGLADELRGLRHDLADTRARLDAVAGLGDRLMELEERMDFTERMLAREGDRPALERGS